MSPYCLKCRLIMVKQWYYQKVQYVVLKNQDLLKTRSKWNIKWFSS